MTGMYITASGCYCVSSLVRLLQSHLQGCMIKQTRNLYRPLRQYPCSLSSLLHSTLWQSSEPAIAPRPDLPQQPALIGYLNPMPCHHRSGEFTWAIGPPEATGMSLGLTHRGERQVVTAKLDVSRGPSLAVAEHFLSCRLAGVPCAWVQLPACDSDPAAHTAWSWRYMAQVRHATCKS